ncbi:MAG: PQQ-dependent sugar dehydrogenase [Acidobacteriota bacterium]|nr:PQQ-dependent sugar dehydrogenase [Acidobacteriota bacterium]
MLNFVIRLSCCLLLIGAMLVFGNRSRLFDQTASAQTTIQLQQFATGFSFPILMTSARDSSNRIFIVERTGKIQLMTPGTTSPLPTPFLDLTAKVLTTTGIGDERGLLGLAFHPQFKTNRRFFVNYTRRNDGATVISEFTASAANANVADTTEKPILTITQPFSNHNGGMMDFGKDGFLYIGMGDGGSANDPGNRSQNIEELLGKFLRIDVDTPNGAVPYSSPSTNPFFGATPGRDEIYSTGWRNPWRWSFDRQTGELYAGDVGQNAIEEIDIVTLGGNYGWRVLEGTRCTNLGPAACTTPGFVAPIHEYAQSGGRCSVTGGYVYRGTRATLTPGTYVFGDYCTGEIFLRENGSVRMALDSPYSISSFGEDESGELYVVHLGSGANGAVYRIVNPNATATTATSVSAANFRSPLARESISAVFGTDLAVVTLPNSGGTLPTNLGGTQISVTDSAGTSRAAQLFFVSPTQANYLIPAGTGSGTATVTITNWSGALSRGTVQINPVAPGLFTANSSGRGVPAAVAERILANGSRSTVPVAAFDATQNQFVPVPIDLGTAADSVFLAAFGTGFRFRSALTAVTAIIGGTPAEVSYAGPQNDFVGLDQANVRIPFSLAGRGEVDVVLTVDGVQANIVRINVK